ncbi:uncharacterized protein BXZ73DRAFT_105084 [Epithele typhae]|uniref:uncharacterized protein n=1 Tax=Epithele typhae TaxID=378194 RepID=UPI00200877FB|nr:uncharacterized protein BXZ73DRAFT_105084 [Epithele typhae]KAH9918930.1 hypothetical protein BXZ73DRAFT_105084 [Epithele typhae]
MATTPQPTHNGYYPFVDRGHSLSAHIPSSLATPPWGNKTLTPNNKVTLEDELAEFKLKVYRGEEHKELEVKMRWDDEVLLNELAETYDALRGWRGKWLSVKCIKSLMIVEIDPRFVWPQRKGMGALATDDPRRIRRLLAHPQQRRGQRHIINSFARERENGILREHEFGVEFVECNDSTLILALVFVSTAAIPIVAVVYATVVGNLDNASDVSNLVMQVAQLWVSALFPGVLRFKY